MTGLVAKFPSQEMSLWLWHMHSSCLLKDTVAVTSVHGMVYPILLWNGRQDWNI